MACILRLYCKYAFMKKKKSEIKMQQLDERDFVKEYNDLMELMGNFTEVSNFDNNEPVGHIKKFSLLKKTPVPILTNYTFTIIK